MSFEEHVPNEHLRRARHRKGWTQCTLAEMLDTDFETVSRWERGISVPSAYFREKLCTILDKSAEELGLILDLKEPLIPSASSYVFLSSSYADAESKFIARLKVSFQARGIIILSARSIKRQGAENKRKALQEAIRAARAVLLIASPEARSSRHVQETLQIARIYRSRVCTVLIDGEDWQECVPKDSGEFFAMIDARKKNDDQVFDEIIVALGGDRLTRSTTEELAELLIEPRNPFKGLNADWLHEGRDEVRLQKMLSEDVTEWERRGKSRDRLYRGTQLKEVQEWARSNSPGEREIAFLRASAAQRLRSLMYAIMVVLLLLSMTSVAGWFLLHQPQSTEPTLVTTLHDGGPGSLRSSIENAPPGSTIAFAPGLRGVIMLTDGDLQFVRNLKIKGPGANVLAISSGRSYIVHVAHSASISISGLSFKDSVIKEGILSQSFVTNEGVLNLSSCAIFHNHSANGGGGGIFNDGILTLTSSTVSYNSAEAPIGPIFGGGISNDGTLTLTNSTVSYNSVGNGDGGGISNDGTLTLTNSTVSNNSVRKGDGGGISNNGILTLTNSTVSNNSGGKGGGGGIFNIGPLNMVNSTVANNIAQTSGGGIEILGSPGKDQSSLTFCTVFGNRAARGGGIASELGSDRKVARGGGIASEPGSEGRGVRTIPAYLHITSSIIADNFSSTGPDILGSFISGGYNLIQNLSGATVNDPGHKHSTDLVGITAANLQVDSKLRDNEGSTQTLALLLGSPASDRIPSSACSVDGITTDQRGVRRPDENESLCDIGAYESAN